MEVVMLGTGGIFSARASSSFLIDRRILVDCPNGCVKGMRRLGHNPAAVDACVITHFHGDHYYDIPFLLLEVALRQERDRAFVVAGPKGVHQRVRDLFMLAYPEEWETVQRNGHIKWVEVQDRRRFGLLGYSALPYAVRHAEYDAYGYVISAAAGTVLGAGLSSVGFTGDTSLCEGAEKIVARSKVAFVDCSFPSGTPNHMGCDDYLRLRASHGDECTIVPTHMGDDVVAALQKSGVLVPDDGAVFRV